MFLREFYEEMGDNMRKFYCVLKVQVQKFNSLLAFTAAASGWFVQNDFGIIVTLANKS